MQKAPKPRLAAAFSVAAIAAITACIFAVSGCAKGSQTLTIYPDGTGKVEFDFTWKLTSYDKKFIDKRKINRKTGIMKLEDFFSKNIRDNLFVEVFEAEVTFKDKAKLKKDSVIVKMTAYFENYNALVFDLGNVKKDEIIPPGDILCFGQPVKFTVKPVKATDGEEKRESYKFVLDVPEGKKDLPENEAERKAQIAREMQKLAGLDYTLRVVFFSNVTSELKKINIEKNAISCSFTYADFRKALNEAGSLDLFDKEKDEEIAIELAPMTENDKKRFEAFKEKLARVKKLYKKGKLPITPEEAEKIEKAGEKE